MDSSLKYNLLLVLVPFYTEIGTHADLLDSDQTTQTRTASRVIGKVNWSVDKLKLLSFFLLDVLIENQLTTLFVSCIIIFTPSKTATSTLFDREVDSVVFVSKTTACPNHHSDYSEYLETGPFYVLRCC